MATNSIGQIKLDLVLNKKNFDKDVNRTVKNAENAFSKSFNRIGTVIATAFSIGVVTKFGKSVVDAASQAQAAWTGLNSIVQGTGNSFDKAHDFLTKFTKDGLVGIEDAATAYKNLLARGYDTTQIENVMTRLKDSAAFGRQSSYTLSQAVVSATEGLKNENSILVDNAGVTKNVAKMWEEYAASIGKTSNNLTQQEKIQAEVNGIMKETAFQAGDAATYTNTFAGKVSVLKGAFSSMKTAIGKVVAPIVGLFIPAITAAINAITAFFTKLQGVLSVFGLEFPDVVEKTSTGISGIGDSANTAAGNIASTGDAATKAAKKINKAFAGVDEINVLSSPNKSSDSSDGSSGGGTGGSTGGAVSTGNDVVGSAIGNTADKIMKFIKPLQDISFDNLINAFNRLKDAIAPIGKTLFAGLEWAYFNLLVPLAQWTIEDLLPAFLDLLSGALKVLNPILVAFGNVFEPIWDNLLKPLLSWTGGAIVSVIEGVADALSKVGDWMSENQSVVDVMVAALTTFFGLWELTKLAAFIQMSGGIVAAFNLMTGSIVANTAAKLIDKAETVYLTALYAKDFVVAIASGTAALVKNAAQWVATTAAKVAGTAATVAGTVATTAATAATWLFNTALAVLTSPITLVVAAIAALVAGIVLLIKNWDKVKETAKKVWDNIKSVWGKVSSWFNTNVIQPITKFFTNLWNGIKSTFSSAATWFKNIFAKAWSNIKGAWSSATSWFGNIWSGIKGKFSSVASWFKNTFKNAWNGIKNVFSGVGSFFGGIWSTIKSKFTNIGQKVGDAVGSAFKSAINSLLKNAEKVLNAPIKAINSAIKVLNKAPGVNIGKLKEFSLPRLAQGGWLDKNNPTLALVGDNKHEPEIVSPESKIYEQTRKAVEDAGGNAQNQHFDFTIKLEYPDGKYLIKEINDTQIKDGKISLLV